MTPKQLFIGSGLAFALIWGAQEIQSTTGERAIHEYITKVAQTPRQVSAAYQLVDAMESVFAEQPNSEKALQSSRATLTGAINCIYAAFPDTQRPGPGEVSHHLEDLLLYNQERKLAYTRLNANLSGTTWKLPAHQTCP